MLRKGQPDFPVWQRENVDRFAAEAYERMQQMNEQIQQLQCDFKDAMEQLRELLRQKNDP